MPPEKIHGWFYNISPEHWINASCLGLELWRGADFFASRFFGRSKKWDKSSYECGINEFNSGQLRPSNQWYQITLISYEIKLSLGVPPLYFVLLHTLDYAHDYLNTRSQ